MSWSWALRILVGSVIGSSTYRERWRLSVRDVRSVSSSVKYSNWCVRNVVDGLEMRRKTGQMKAKTDVRCPNRDLTFMSSSETGHILRT